MRQVVLIRVGMFSEEGAAGVLAWRESVCTSEVESKV